MENRKQSHVRNTLAVAVLGSVLGMGVAHGQGMTQPATPQPATPQPPAAQSPTTPSAAATPSTPMASVPGKSELAPSAFGKLDANRRGYVMREDVSQLSGFDKAFQQADANGDGRLNAEEFNRAWSLYSNQK